MCTMWKAGLTPSQKFTLLMLRAYRPVTMFFTFWGVSILRRPEKVRVKKQNGVSSLEELIESARQKGVKFVACQMSMELMGITAEELIDGVELGGVATMLGSAEKSDLTYFI